MDALLNSAPNAEIRDAFVKSYAKIHGYNHDGTIWNNYNNILVSVSGGSDSDIMMDFIERIGYIPGTVSYVFFDTGMEFAATKKHLYDLEEKYNIIINREPAVIPVPLGVKKYGQPFLSKKISDCIHRLQRHDFQWEDKPFDILYQKYPKCKSALRWWCNEWGDGSMLNIERNRLLKEFLIHTPPPIQNISGMLRWR